MALKKTRDLERTRTEILNAAFFEIFTRGFQGVSIDDIVKKTSLTKGAFYHHFPTKLDLGYALVEDTIQGMILSRWILPLKQYDDPIQGIKNRLTVLIGESSQADLEFGCPLNNLIQEMAPVDRGFRKRLKSALELWITGLQFELERGQRTGYVKKSVNTRDAAVFIVMAHEGFYGTLKCLGNKNGETFRALYSALECHLNLFAETPVSRI